MYRTYSKTSAHRDCVPTSCVFLLFFFLSLFLYLTLENTPSPYPLLFPSCSTNSQHVAWFWQVMHELTEEERSLFLGFVTSCPRAPLFGFASLQPKLGVMFGSPDDLLLPTASTCFNMLRMPRYSSKEIMLKKLRYAISAKAGFDMS